MRQGTYRPGDVPGVDGSPNILGEEKAMNADQLKGRWKQFKGELKEKWGKFTDNDLQEIEGNYEKFIGKVQQRYGDKKSELMKWADAWHEKPAPANTAKKLR
jgi:uncharacterized protein YjbJ (UPF0337 family)